jgi:hypothetical protein
MTTIQWHTHLHNCVAPLCTLERAPSTRARASEVSGAASPVSTLHPPHIRYIVHVHVWAQKGAHFHQLDYVRMCTIVTTVSHSRVRHTHCVYSAFAGFRVFRINNTFADIVIWCTLVYLRVLSHNNIVGVHIFHAAPRVQIKAALVSITK